MTGPPLDFVKKEIGKTLNEMQSGAEFYVIFFNSFAVPMPGNKWYKARGEVAKAMTWVQGIQPMGGTEPATAFQAAFQMKPLPDAIWFMTDGQFDPGVTQIIAQLNKPRGEKRVIIHTISFLDNSAANLLDNIAKQSGGTYRHVRGF
jgi:hypothetical protein